MKDLLRTVAAAAVGAAVAVAVVVGQPALAHQTESAKARKVSSAQIKDHTIKTKDLSAQVSGPLAKAGTALQGIPDQSVTSPKIVDHSLTSDDIALVTGSVPVDFGSIVVNTCLSTVGIETGHVVTGDLLLVSQPAGVSGPTSVTAREDWVSPTKIDIIVCNIGSSTVNPPDAVYKWAVISN